MKVEILILVENTTPIPDFQGEYGFAALVTVDGKSFLFDTGSKEALLNNALLAGVDLAQINDLVISHGHFDHTGAVMQFLQMGMNKRIYAHSNIFVPRYVSLGERQREIGVQFKEQEINSNGVELIFTDEFTEIYPEVFVTGEIPRTTDYEDVGGSFWMNTNDRLVADNIADDMSMVINHPEGLIVISGCAHAGIINTIEYARMKTGQAKVLAFIGGTHLIRASEERLAKTVAALREYDVQKIVICHCTGFKATVRLYNDLGSRVIKGETAMKFTF
ncbi:MAG: MBL fold metallo-hydrolase [Firmicutes bacterium HGW-Firmicutes-15]|nr:MAG: MBL fold metallo-hydrolase [Firmicutes bacterium HGW-Firmicutes-15]